MAALHDFNQEPAFPDPPTLPSFDLRVSNRIMFERWLVPALATVLSLSFFVAALASVAYLVFSTAIPCEPYGDFYGLTKVGLIPVFGLSAILMEKMKLAPRLRVFLIALALPTCMVVLHGMAIDWHATAEQSCRERHNGS